MLPDEELYPGGRSTEPARRNLTVMFCDVVGATRLSRDRDVETWFALLRGYYDACARVVERHGGRIVQHQGDGIYVWFGYPTPHGDDAVRAVRAGLELQLAVRQLSAGGAATAPLTVRIAVHAGEVFVTPVEGEGSPLAFGHVPNHAAKLQTAAPPGGVVVSDAVRRLVGEAFELRTEPAAELPDGTVVPAHEVLGERARPGRRRGAGTPLVGRDAERAELTAAWAAVRAGGGAAVAVTGPPGIGSTRLAADLAGDVAGAGDAVLETVSRGLDRQRPYGVFRDLVGQAAGTDPGAPPDVTLAVLRRHLVDDLGMPEQTVVAFGAVLGLREADAATTLQVDPTALVAVTVDALVDWVRRLAARAPLLLLVDDAGDADTASTAALTRLAAEPPAGCLLLLTAAGPHLVPGGDAVRRLPLAALPDSDARRLVAVAGAAAGLSDAQRDGVLRQAGGVPFYLVELTRGLGDAGRGVPITISERLQARFLAPGVDRRVTAALAVAGRPVPAAELARVLELPGAEVTASLEVLVGRDLVTGTPVADARQVYAFRHGVIAEAALALVLQGERERLHGRFADVLAGTATDGVVLGHHLERAGRPFDAYRAYLDAAEAARAVGATAEALRGFGRALEQAARLPDPEVRDVLEVRCRVRRGVTALMAKGFAADEATEDFARCAELCTRLGPRPEHLPAMTGIYTYYAFQCDLGAARRIAAELRSWVDVGTSPENELAFGLLDFMAGDYTTAGERLERAVAGLATAPAMPTEQARDAWLMPFDPLVAALSQLMPVLWVTGRHVAAQEVADRALARAAALPFPEGPYSMAYAKSYLAWVHSLAGFHDSAERIAGDVRDLGHQHGFLFWASTGEIHAAIARFRRTGEAAELATVSEHAFVWSVMRTVAFLPYVLTAEADGWATLGERERADEGFAAAGQLAEELGVRFYEAERLRLTARDPALSAAVRRERLCRAWETAREQGAHVFALRAAIDLARLDPSGPALEQLSSTLALMPGGFGYPEVNEARGVLSGRVPR